MSCEGRKLYPIFKASFHFITLNWPAWAALCALIVFLAPGFHSLWANTLLIPAVCFLCSGFGTAEQALWRKIITKLCIGLGINSCLISVKHFLVALLLSIFYTSPCSIPHHIAHRNYLMLSHKFSVLLFLMISSWFCYQNVNRYSCNHSLLPSGKGLWIFAFFILMSPLGLMLSNISRLFQIFIPFWFSSISRPQTWVLEKSLISCLHSFFIHSAPKWLF